MKHFERIYHSILIFSPPSVWQHFDLSNMGTVLCTSGNPHPVHRALADLSGTGHPPCPQPHQDIPHTQGDKKPQGRNSPGTIQPTEFNQLDHERKFKRVLGGIFTATLIYILSALALTHLLGAGTNIHVHSNAHPCVPGKAPFLALLMDVEEPKSHVIIYFHATSATLTVLFMIGSDIFVRFSRRSQPTPANASTTIINTIPFSTLNISIALTIVANVITSMFGVTMINGMQSSMILAALLVTNRAARKHVRIRLRQNIDSLTIGRLSTNRVEPVVSIALVPIRDFRGIQ